jgi:arginyl-tRNA synthetase
MSATGFVLDPCRAELGEKLLAALRALAPDAPLAFSAADIARLIERPPEQKLGDYALPCFRFAKDTKKKPQEIATALAAALTPGGWVAGATVAGAFLNITVNKQKLAETVLPAVRSGAWFSRLKESGMARDRVMIEYSQPNTHKEFHVGHGRNVCLGNSLVRLLRYSGYDVVAANYFGDEGTHIATILWYLTKYGKEAPASGRGEWLGKMYVESKKLLGAADDEAKKKIYAEISAVHRAIESKSGDVYKLWLETRQWSLDDFHAIYEWLGVEFDEIFYESEVTEEAQQIVDEYYKKGVFVLDDGAIGVDLKEWKLGFSILRKRDGNTLYATKDLALARRKFEKFNIDRSIYVVADEQNHHFKQVFKDLELMGFPQAKKCFHLSYGMVVLPEGKMSSRDGNSVTFNELRALMTAELSNILQKYASDWTAAEIADTTHKLCDGAIKYGMLVTDPAREIVFNLTDWLAFDGNSGPYLMYSYARTRSVLRKAADQGFSPSTAGVAGLADPTEHDLLRYVYDFNDVASNAGENCKPSQLASHLYYMCKAFNRFYAEVQVLKSPTPELRDARLALIEAFATTLKQGLGLLGITPPERM